MFATLTTNGSKKEVLNKDLSKMRTFEPTCSRCLLRHWANVEYRSARLLSLPVQIFRPFAWGGLKRPEMRTDHCVLLACRITGNTELAVG
eukprot:6200900-Pleurochrysis_carterae.AAC.1